MSGRSAAAGFARALDALAAPTTRSTVAAQLNLLSPRHAALPTLAGGRPRRGPAGDPAPDDAARRALRLLRRRDRHGGRHDPDCRRAFPAGADGRDEALRATFRDLIAAAAGAPGAARRRLRVAVAAVARGPRARRRDDPSAQARRWSWSSTPAASPGGARGLPGLAGTRLEPLAIAGLPAGSPLEVARRRNDGRSPSPRGPPWSSLRRVSLYSGSRGRPPLRAGRRREHAPASPGRRRRGQNSAGAGSPRSVRRSGRGSLRCVSGACAMADGSLRASVDRG